MGAREDFRASGVHLAPGRISMKAPKKIGAANRRNAEGDPIKIDLAGELITPRYSQNVLDFQTKMPIDAYRERWVRRRVHVGPELAAYLAAMAFSGGGR